MRVSMFGRRKRNIHREADDLRKRLEHLEGEAEQLHAEIESLEARKNDPYSRPLVGTMLHGPDVYIASLPMRGRRPPDPTRRQFRRKRNLAVTLIIASVFVLTWIIAKFWRYVS